MVRPFGILHRRRSGGRLVIAAGLLVTTALVGMPEARAAGELSEISADWEDFALVQAFGVSGDGSRVVGWGFDYVAGGWRPALATPEGLIRLATLGGVGEVSAISGNGAHMVGYVESGNGSGVTLAALWNATGALTALGTLNPTSERSFSRARDVSGDGTRAVGRSVNNGSVRGFVWVEGANGGVDGNRQMYQLPGLPVAGRHEGRAISDDGMFAVGFSSGEAHTGRAVRWDLSTIADNGVAGIIDLGSFTGMGGGSDAYDVSADGRVVVGEASDPDGRRRAFRWVEGATGGVAANVQMYDLGTLGGDESWAQAVSRNGNWVVGTSTADEGFMAFRWSETDGMESVAAWLARHGVDVGDVGLLNATSISDDGNVIVGDNSRNRAFIARVAPEPGPGPGDGPGPGPGPGPVTGLMDVAEYQQTLFSTTQIAHAGEFLTWLPMNGAHHRPLMQQGSLEDGHCAWATGDFGVHGGSETALGLAEAGACVELFGGTVKAGLGFGTSHSWQNLALGGSSRLSGQYVLGEVDWQPDGSPLLLSVTAMLGGWQANLHRGYSNGAATAYSDGTTGIGAGVVRLRADWLEAASFGNTTINPWASVTFGRQHIAAFTESGGPFPAHFDAQTLGMTEVRLGLAAVSTLSTQTTLTTSLELAHRSGDAPKASGAVAGLFDFSLGGGTQSSTWLRAGLELDHHLNDSTALSASIHAATNGRDPSVSGSVGVKVAF
ncbi:MAG TPA: autotransporter domain-containing protein [Devosia sp.]|jgi:probable HAF family extracellular repeat protein|nr:autotransporter domain-containing protein [Devosia sp.]